MQLSGVPYLRQNHGLKTVESIDDIGKHRHCAVLNQKIKGGWPETIGFLVRFAHVWHYLAVMSLYGTL